MSFFNTSATLRHVTPLPAGTTLESALEKLQDHDLLIRLDPELASYETMSPPADSPNTKRYKVTDHMHTLPRGLWDTTVSFEALITNTENGVEWIIKAPLGLVQTSRWQLLRSDELEKGKGKEKADEEGKGENSEWCLVEDVEIKASRLVVGTVRNKCEENWRGVHSRFLGHLKGTTVAA